LILLSAYTLAYIKHNFMQPEFEVRKQPNILIPKNIYEVRRKSYIYWEISRIARGMKKNFSYYNYDREAVNKFIKLETLIFC
jgi:hypothetical protein